MSDRPTRQKQSVSQIVLFVHNQTTIVKIISIASKRWKPITSQPGAEEAKPIWQIVKCFARYTIE